MSKFDDQLSALLPDIVRVLPDSAPLAEATAAKIAGKIIQAMRLRYEGKTTRFGQARISNARILAAFDGRNHQLVCKELGISHRTLYRAIQQTRGEK